MARPDPAHHAREVKRLIVTADDFGLSEAVNEGVERAHREGILTSASLMVAGAAAADAVARARRMPGLQVGLHLVAVEGPSMRGGWLSSDQAALGVRYFFLPAERRRLAAEIRAQFEAFAATRLPLDHADAHKHMHLHPTVGALLISIGQEFGLRAVRVPNEPSWVAPSLAGRAMAAWSGLLRHQVRAAGMACCDQVFGLTWSGAMTEARVLRVLANLPDGISEMYFHPAAGRDALLDRWMPSYQHEAELAALVSPAVRAAVQAEGVVLAGYSNQGSAGVVRSAQSRDGPGAL